MAFNTIKRPFLHQSGDKFADLVEEHLKLVMPNITQSKRLGDLDQQGIDVLQFEENEGGVLRAVQCKGYERPYNTIHTDGLIKEIRKFLNKGPDVNEYWLVINKPIMDRTDRQKIERELTELEKVGKAKRTMLLDLDPFAKHLEALAIEKFRFLASANRIATKTRYLSSFDTVAYVDDVPISIDKTPKSNLVKSIVSSVASLVKKEGSGHTGNTRKYPRYLLTGSFGFGETMGLHNLGQSWADQSFDAIFVPAVNLHDEAFVNSAGIYDFIVNELFADDEEFTEDHVGYKLLREACKSVLNSEPWFLLIDAIDESEFWSDANRLSSLWYSIREIGLPAIVSVRSELVASRPAEFFGYLKDDFFTRVELLDWSFHEMSKFLSSFVDMKGSAPPPSFTKFKRIVDSGEYEDAYGDIPRRPLFLQMLAEDAWEGYAPEEKLFRLYGKYFRAKMKRDWIGADTPGKTLRNNILLKKFGIEEAQEQIISMMEDLALTASGYNSADEQAGSSHLRTTQLTINQKDLDDGIYKVLGERPRVEDILLSSIIQPAGRHPVDRQRVYRFAHQSFADWFIARAVARSFLSVSGLSATASSFQKSIREAVDRREPLP